MKKSTIFLIIVFIALAIVYLCKLTSNRNALREKIRMEQDSLLMKEIQDSIKYVQDSIKQVESIELTDKVKNNTIEITRLKCSSPNSAGGVDVYFNFKNKSDKVIKYLTANVYFTNAVDDVVESEIGLGQRIFNLKCTGPIKPQESNSWNRYWDCVIYNSTAKQVHIKGIDIEYMDGSMIFIGENNVKLLKGYK